MSETGVPANGRPQSELPKYGEFEDLVEESDEPVDDPTPWRMLSARVVGVDVARSLLAISPTVIAFLVFDVAATPGVLYPLLGFAAWGIGRSVIDLVRWATTRYRVTPELLERRTGLFVRSYRTAHRSRIRTVDLDAKFLHRLAGLRVVRIGAGQNVMSLESVLSLDSITVTDGRELQRVLAGQSDEEGTTIVRRRARWFIYMAISGVGFMYGLSAVGGIFGFASIFNIDVFGPLWEALGFEGGSTPRNVALGLVIMFGLSFIAGSLGWFTSTWDFRLARVPNDGGTALRTTQGLFRLRDVVRDESRTRGYRVNEPLVWRWRGVFDLEIITTGLSIFSSTGPAALMPRADRAAVLDVVDQIVSPHTNPFRVRLTRHPVAALRRRLVWAVMTSIVVAAVVGYGWWLGALQAWLGWAVAVFAVLSLVAAVLGYRALAHAVDGDRIIVRSGVMWRATSALDTSAVSTVIIRQSFLQRRLGLASLRCATAAGYTAYDSIDMAAADVVDLAVDVNAELVEQFTS